MKNKKFIGVLVFLLGTLTLYFLQPFGINARVFDLVQEMTRTEVVIIVADSTADHDDAAEIFGLSDSLASHAAGADTVLINALRIWAEDDSSNYNAMIAVVHAESIKVNNLRIAAEADTANYNTGYIHSQVSSGNPHSVTAANVSALALADVEDSTAAYNTRSGTTIQTAIALVDTTEAVIARAAILFDADFGSAGIMKTDGSGGYSILTDGSTDWEAAHDRVAADSVHWTDGYNHSLETSGNPHSVTAAEVSAVALTAVDDSLAAYLARSGTDPLLLGELRAKDGNGLKLYDDSGTAGLFVEDGGNVGIGITSPDGLLDLRGGNFVLSNSGITHPFTDLFPTNVYGGFFPNSTSTGGLVIDGLSDHLGASGMIIRGFIGSTNPMDTVAAVGFCAGKSDGSTGKADLGALETAYQFSNNDNTTKYLTILGGGGVGIGTATPNQKLTIEGTVSLKEQAAAGADTAAYGQIWVKTATPNELWFTDDAGTDAQLGLVGGDVTKVGTPANDQVGVWTGDGTIEGAAGLTYNGSTLGLSGSISLSGTDNIVGANAMDIYTTGTGDHIVIDPHSGGAANLNLGVSGDNDLINLYGTVTADGTVNATTFATTNTTFANRLITSATGGVLNIALSAIAGDDFTIDTNKLVVEGDTGNVGINDATPSFKLDVNGKIGIGGVQTIYNAQAEDGFTGSLIFGNGGENLSHTTGGEGYYNTFMGIGSGYSNTTGANNSAMGQNALNANTTGYGNSAMGRNAFHFNTTGSNNVVIGFIAGRYHANGATALVDAENSIYIGYGAKGYDNSDDNSIVIGSNAIGIGANTVVLGNDSIITTALKGDITTGVWKSYIEQGMVDDWPADDSYNTNDAVHMVVGEAVILGDPLHIHTDGKLTKSDADSSITMPVAYIALATASADDTCLVARAGMIRDASRYDWTVGGVIYASATLGTLTQTAPAGDGDIVQVVGISTHADAWDIRISLDQIEVEVP